MHVSHGILDAHVSWAAAPIARAFQLLHDDIYGQGWALTPKTAMSSYAHQCLLRLGYLHVLQLQAGILSILLV